MALTSYNVKLKINNATYDIKDFPDLMADRSSVESTTLSDDARTYEQGIRQTPEAFDFTANFDKEEFETLNAMTTVQTCELDYPDGSKFQWSGKVSVSNLGTGVDSILEMRIRIVPTTVVTFTAGA